MAYVGVTEIKSSTGSTASGTVTATAGNALLATVAASNDGTPHGTSTVARTGDTWTTHFYQEYPLNNHDGIYLASAPNCAGGAVTCTFSCTTGAGGMMGWVLEYSGLPTSSIVDTTANGNAASVTTASTPSLTNTQATALFIAGIANYDGGNPATITSTGSGWTVAGSELNGALYYPNAIAYKEVTSIAAQQETFTVGSFMWATVIGSFKIGGTSGTTGTIAANLARLVVASSGAETFSGTVGANLARPVAAASGTVASPGALVANLAGPVLAASGTETFSSTVAANLPKLTVNAGGSVTVSGNAGSITATLGQLRVVSRPLATYPLKVVHTAGNYYLADQNNVATWLQAEAPWSLISQCTNTDIDDYLASRFNIGVNAILLELIEHKFADHAPNNIDNVAPFTGANFTTPNSTYFTRADYVVAQAARYGMTVFMDPLYLGFAFGDEGWAQEVKVASTADMQSWASFVGNRYKTSPNIVWVVGGDVDPRGDATIQARTSDFAVQLAATDTNHLITAHNNGTSLGTDSWSGATWLTLNTVYAHPIDINGLSQSAHAIAKPYVEIETYYEGEHSTTAQTQRSNAWWSALSGNSGFFFGNWPLWNFGASAASSFGDGSTNADWHQNLNTPGARGQKNAADLLRPRAWQDMVPDFSHTFVISGYGTLGTSGYVGSAITPAGTLGMIYTPGGTTFTVDFSQFTATVSQTWVDPSNGQLIPIGSHANSGTTGFNPGTNAGGDADWVLLLEATQAISGTLASNLPRLQVAGSGTVGTPSVSGTLASTLPSLQAVGSGTVSTPGGLIANLPRLQVAASGTVTANFLGSLASNLPSLSVASTGTETFSGSSSVVLQRVQVFATQAYLANLGLTLQRVTLAAHGSVSAVIQPEPEPIIPPSRRPPPPLHPVPFSRPPSLRVP